MVRISYDTFLETKELVKQIEEDEQKLTYMEKAKLEKLSNLNNQNCLMRIVKFSVLNAFLILIYFYFCQIKSELDVVKAEELIKDLRERLDENKMKCDFFNLIIERQDKRIFEIKEKILSGRQYLKMFRSSNL